ncbi:Guanylyl cyclase [Leishmania donovani]|uniref:Hypothetical_protein_conserved n=1 Tax=Leishmania donovani TaxID=5661 RepID=A0A6J8FST4_LEIDO|nr:Guanylyl cyclase [Leishmania donovani]VDZ49766.1 hypothetical_protein_conserved [Leishmania donovani]
MEFAKRISELAHLVRRLSRVQADEARSRRLLASARSAPNLVEDEVGLRISAGQQRVRSPASVHHHALSGCAAAQNQLLLRRIPLSVSLVERSWWKLECRQRQREVQRIAAQASAGAAAGTTAGSASSPPASSATGSAPSVAPVMQPEKSKTLSIVQPSPAASRQHIDAVVLLLKLLHSVEEARRQLLWRKEGAARRRCTAADDKWQQFQEEFAPQLRRRNRKSGKQDDVHREDSVALLRETANMLQERCRAAKADASLLRASLLARSFVSARLWELLLRKSVWTAAVVEHKHAAAVDESSLAAPHATRLLLMCLAFTRLSMGVLRDYVEGRCFSRHAPRFVVSMPSRSWQSRKRNVDARSLDGDAARSAAAADTSVEAGDGARDSKDRSTADATPGSNQEDALFSILQGALQVPSSAAADIALAASAPLARDSASKSTRRKRRPGRVASMRWIPPHTAHVIPLASETLALHTFVLPEMDVPTLLRLGCAAELVDLCVTLQRLASCVLVLSPQQTPSLADSKEAAKSLQRTLHCLEDAIATVGRQVKTHLVAEQNVRLSSQPIAAATTLGRLKPADAARLAVQLHTLRLLPVGDADAAFLLSQLLRDMFPELRTKTSRVLREKARQSSLLAFATRPHRMKLYVQHGRQGAEGYVLGTIVQQARLQQRQLAAALRAQHISEVHVQQLGVFAESLPPSELVRLIQLCASHANRSHATQQRALSAEAFDTPVTGCLFLAEALLISGALQTTPDQPSTLSLQELAILWDAATLLYPLICARRAQQLVGGAGRLRLSHAVKSEFVIWATFAEHVLVMANGALAQRLQNLEKLRQHESTAMRRARITSERKAASDVAAVERETALIDSRITADALVSLAAGVLEYAEHDDSVSARSVTASTHSSSLPVQNSVRVLARLLQELVFHDRQLWHSLRILPATQRSAVERQLAMCFQTMGMLDETTTRALDALSRRSHVEL